MLDYLESRPFHGIHWTTGINEKGRKILGAKNTWFGYSDIIKDVNIRC